MKAVKTAGWKTAEEIPEALRAHLGRLLLSLADNKRLLGMRYSEWILGAPTLEAGIACSAMAQDEWGHGRILYAMLKDFGYDPGALEHERKSGEYLNSELLDAPPEEWPTLLALNALFDTAVSIQCEALTESRFTPLHYKIGKLLDEERFHYEHGRGWTARLASTDAGRDALAAAFSAARDACLRWFGSPDGEIGKQLAAEGIIDADPESLRERWIERVRPMLASVGVPASVSVSDLDWGGWDDARRRFGDGGPDAATLARVRGDKNRSMLMD